MPPGSAAKYLLARLEAARVATIAPEAAPPIATWNMYVWVESADETAAKVRDAGGTVAEGAVGRHGRWPDGGLHRSRGRGVRHLAAEGHRGAEIVNEPGSRELQRPEHARPRSGEALLRRRLRLAGDRLDGGFGCGLCPATATSSRRRPRTQAAGRGGRAGGLRGRRRPLAPIAAISPTCRRTGA